MDENLLRLDARLGALELLIRNLNAQRYVGQSDPLAAAEQAAREIEQLSRRIKVQGSEPVINDLLASEAEEFLVAMFREIEQLSRRIKVQGSEPVINDLLASEAEEFLVAMFRETVEIVRENSKPQPTSDIEQTKLPNSSRKTTEWPSFPRTSPKLRRTG